MDDSLVRTLDGKYSYVVWADRLPNGMWRARYRWRLGISEAVQEDLLAELLSTSKNQTTYGLFESPEQAISGAQAEIRTQAWGRVRN